VTITNMEIRALCGTNRVPVCASSPAGEQKRLWPRGAPTTPARGVSSERAVARAPQGSSFCTRLVRDHPFVVRPPTLDHTPESATRGVLPGAHCTPILSHTYKIHWEGHSDASHPRPTCYAETNDNCEPTWDHPIEHTAGCGCRSKTHERRRRNDEGHVDGREWRGAPLRRAVHVVLCTLILIHSAET